MRRPWAIIGLVLLVRAWCTVPVAAGAPAATSYPASAPARADLVISRVLLVTVTDTWAVLTWESSEPAASVVHYGTRRDRLDQIAREVGDGGGPGRFHYCELGNLQPGTTYYYICQSGPARSGGQLIGPGQFTTLAPPPGRELFSFATMTDTHVGQDVVAALSLRGKVVSRGARWPEPAMPFWRLAIEGAIQEINAGSVAFTVVKGDITDGRSIGEFTTARRLLGQLKRPYYVVHGNHDLSQPFLRTFGLKQPWYSFDHDGVHFVVLDTEPLAGSDPAALEQQFNWLAADLRDRANAWTFVFVHRPVLPKLTRESGEPLSEELLKAGSGVLGKLYGPGATRVIDQATGQSPNVIPANAVRLAELLRSHGRIAGVFAGHLHRNYVGYWPEQTGNLPYVETASTKEYPCGYSIARVFTGGYMQNYYVPRDPRCREWSAMSQDAYARIGLQSKAGTVGERNFVVRFEDMNLSPIRPETRPASEGQKK